MLKRGTERRITAFPAPGNKVFYQKKQPFRGMEGLQNTHGIQNRLAIAVNSYLEIDESTNRLTNLRCGFWCEVKNICTCDIDWASL